MKQILLLMFFLHGTASLALAAPLLYATAERALPVFNSPTAAASKTAIKPDSCGQVRSLEFVALPGTAFTLISQAGDEKSGVLEVATRDYQTPPGTRLYLAAAGVKLHQQQPPERTRPAKIKRETVAKNLRSAVGAHYIWGSNLRSGVTLEGKSGLYAGLDCSGLLYEATEGFTPRNTAELVDFGTAVPVAGLSRDQILARLKPLDLIVWKGHVVIVLDREQTIESVLWCKRPGNGGVVTSPLRHRLGEIMARRKGVDSWPAGGGKPQLFVVRRWLE